MWHLALLVTLAQAHVGNNDNDGSDVRNGPWWAFESVPIINDCAGDMGPEAETCVCRKQYGFYKSTCEAGQSCFRSDGRCRTPAQVTCSALLTNAVVYYTTESEAQPVGNANGITFTDMGKDYNLIVMAESANCELDQVGQTALVCTTADGSPWSGALTMNGAVDADVNASVEASIDLVRRSRYHGKWRRNVDNCPNTAVKHVRSYSPFIRDDPSSCTDLDEMECGARRALGVNCCYKHGANAQCEFNRRCSYDGGLYVLKNNDWEQQTFGTPESNHVSLMDPRMIVGQDKLPTDDLVLSMEHNHAPVTGETPEDLGLGDAGSHLTL